MIKGLLVLLGVFLTLMALLIWAKSRPAPSAAELYQGLADPQARAASTFGLDHLALLG